jgi:hypothetical protein
MGGLHLVNKKLKANKEEKTKKGMTKKSGVLADAGKGLVNLAIGGRTVAAKPGKFLRRGTPEQWQPFHGIQQLGSVKQTHTEGPLKGMIKYDKDGEPLYEKSKDLFKYLGQEFRGPKPTRADMMAHARARSMPIDDAAFEAHLKQNKLPYKKSLFGKLTAAPGIERPTVGFMGADSREAARFARTAKGADHQALEEVNNLGHMEFMKKHPGLAAEWYGRNALHKGFFVGLPAYEAYNIGIKKEPIHEGEGMGSNMASSVGAGLGMAAGAPLGLFGAPLLSMATQAGGRAMGKQVDQSMGNRPMQAPAPEMTPVPRTVPR